MQSEIVLDTEIFDISNFDYEKLPEFWVKTIPVGWIKLLQDYQNEIRDVGIVISHLVKNKGVRICPEPWNIYRCFNLCPWYKVKVVIIGQDPYYQIGKNGPVATGCCFENREGDGISRSLENIFLVLNKTVEGFEIPKTGDLRKWASQGVLLFNASLTTSEGVANEHKDIWKFFPIRILQFLSKVQKNVVYMLWGAEAKKHITSINKNANLVLEANHPVARSNVNSFLNCNHFNEANEYLIAHDKTPIDWHL